MTEIITSDPRVRSAIAHWAPRMVANGVDYNDFVTTTARVTSWSDWCAQWSLTAVRHERIAADATARGNHLSAADAYARAAMCHHFGKFVFFDDATQYALSSAATIANYRLATPHLRPAAELVQVPYQGSHLPGYLRRPTGIARPPVVLIICGLDSVKEEMATFEPLFHARGMATLTVDGPGQGEAENLPIEPVYEIVVGAIIDFLFERQDVDASRVGAVGISLGGYYAGRAAAHEKRLGCAVSVGGPYDMGTVFDDAPSLTQHAIRVRAQLDDLAQARDFAQRLTLADCASQITRPFFIVFGRQDRLIPYSQAQRLFSEIDATDKRLDLHDDGNHVCNNIPFAWRPLVADWVGGHLGASDG
jgi:dienelactone hydrolase